MNLLRNPYTLYSFLIFIQNSIMSQGCGHTTCDHLRQSKASESVGTALLLDYKQKFLALAVGEEVAGTYAHEFNLCAGKGEKKTDFVKGLFCWIKCLRRELIEEFKIDANGKKDFDDIFRGSNGKIRIMLHNNTPIFIGVLPKGFSRKPIKAQMISDLQNPGKPPAYKEMSDFEYIRLDSGNQIDGRKIKVSVFADRVRQRIDVTKL